MSASRSLLLLMLICGLMWARKIVQGQGSVAKSSPDILLQAASSESPESKESLSYGFKKTLRTSPSRDIATEKVRTTHPDETISLEEIHSLKTRPFSLIATAQQHLLELSSEQISKRSTLLRAVASVQSAEHRQQISDLFEQEADWLQRETLEIQDTQEFAIYIDELMRLSLSSVQTEEALANAIQTISQAVAQHPQAMQSLENSIQKYMPWKYNEWAEAHQRNKK